MNSYFDICSCVRALIKKIFKKFRVFFLIEEIMNAPLLLVFSGI